MKVGMANSAKKNFDLDVLWTWGTPPQREWRQLRCNAWAAYALAVKVCGVEELSGFVDVG
jgi:hypothetical protein